MIQTYDFNGAGREVNAKGNFFRYESGLEGAGITDLKLTIDGNYVGVFSPGDGLELPSDAKRWELKPVSNGCTGTVKIGAGRVTSTKLAGVVQTVDGGRARSLGGQAFSGYALCSAVASQFPYVQLWNASTDKNLIVNGVILLSNMTSGFHARSGQTVVSASSTPGLSKRFGGAASASGVIKSANNASSDAFGLVAGAHRFVLVSTGGVVQQYRPTEPVVVPPGWGLTFNSYVSGGDLGVTFEWFEEAA